MFLKAVFCVIVSAPRTDGLHVTQLKRSKQQTMKYQMKISVQYSVILIILLICALTSGVFAQTHTITGVIYDAKSKEPLPFATIGFRSVNIGTVSDSEGKFTIRFSQEHIDDGITVSYIGYEDYTFPANTSEEQEIYLKESVYQFDEVVVNSLSPEEYLKKVIKRISENNLDVPFQTVAYFREKMEENEIPVKFTEAVFMSYQHPYFIDSANQHRLVLHRELAEAELQFMREKAEKRKAKKQQKAEKRGEEVDEEEDYSLVQASFGGPEAILKGDPVRSLTDFMDSTLFRKYRYEFTEHTTYNGKSVEVISFSSKGTVDNQKYTGLIYIDKASLAIIKIEKKGKFVIPFALKPVLYALGFSFSGGEFYSSYKYKSFQGKWYPENLEHNIGLKITRHKMFSKNEWADLLFELVMSTKSIDTDLIKPIEVEKRFVLSKKMEEQVYEQKGIDWSIIQ